MTVDAAGDDVRLYPISNCGRDRHADQNPARGPTSGVASSPRAASHGALLAASRAVVLFG